MRTPVRIDEDLVIRFNDLALFAANHDFKTETAVAHGVGVRNRPLSALTSTSRPSLPLRGYTTLDAHVDGRAPQGLEASLQGRRDQAYLAAVGATAGRLATCFVTSSTRDPKPHQRSTGATMPMVRWARA